MPVAAAGNSTNAHVRDAVNELNDILHEWEDDQITVGHDPVPQLIRLCELFELHTNSFLKTDPDPFDDRHPATCDPDGVLGQLLRVFFKKDIFVNKLVSHYLRDTYFTSQGVARDSIAVNTAACRLMLNVMYGFEVPQVFRDSEPTVTRLFSWAEKAPEPLRSYATGLLAAAVDLPDIATTFKDSNAHLLPIMLNRLWDLKDDGGSEEPNVGGTQLPSRPFAHLSRESHSYSERQGVSDDTGVQLFDAGEHSSPINASVRSRTSQHNASQSSAFNASDTSVPGLSCMMSDAVLNSDCSNSSWAEMSNFIVGSYQMFPVTRDTKVLFILKYLKPVGEYQESLANVIEYRALDLIFHYINVRKTCHARLSFEALRFLGSLLFHKKFCLEFVNRGGVQLLLQIPRPSLTADGVALCLWYLGYCEEAVEKMCVLNERVVTQLIKYGLWLVESGHSSARTHAVMFFGLIFKFRVMLEQFDQQDGLRRIMNVVSTMSILQNINNSEDIDLSSDETMIWQTAKHACLAIKNYFDAHLAIRASSSSFQRSVSAAQLHVPHSKPLNVTNEAVDNNIEMLLQNLTLRMRWEPVENFLKLNGVQILIQIVSVVLIDAYNTHRSETAVSALEALRICALLPQVQQAFSDKVTIPAEEDIFFTAPIEAPGYSVLVACIPEGNQLPINTTSDVQIAALKVLVNCLCAPLKQDDDLQASSSSASKNKIVSLIHPPIEEIVKKSWDCVRNSNGIMYLLSLLHKKLPIADADVGRALACRALVGLSRSEAARQIMSKLPLLTQGQVQLLMKEPILQEKRAEHVKFQRYCLELLSAVSGKTNNKTSSSGGGEISLHSIHKADVVAQTKIGYNRKQLLQLIQMHLIKEGLTSSALALQREAQLPNPLHTMPPPRAIASVQGARTRLHGTPTARNLFLHSPMPRTPSTPMPSTPSLPSTFIGGGLPPSSGGPTPLTIRVNRGVKRSLNGNVINNSPNTTVGTLNDSLSTPVFSRSEMTNSPSVLANIDNVMGGGSSQHGISLDGIVREYLTNQHALCQHPVVTCPTFDLFQPHRCPEPRNNRRSGYYNNICHRITHRSYTTPRLLRNIYNSGCNTIQDNTTTVMPLSLASLDRHYIYSRYRPADLIKPPVGEEIFLSVAFCNDDKSILVGTERGNVSLFTFNNSREEMVFSAHSSGVTHICTHKSIPLVLTSSSSASECALWAIEDLVTSDVDPKFQVEGSDAIFNKALDKILTTSNSNANLYDISSEALIHSFQPKLSNHYTNNKADIHPQDDLILTDGVLFDVRSGKEIHKFDKINKGINGKFHHNGLEIISSSEVWDLRTYHLLHTVSALTMCNVLFNHTSDVLFGVLEHDEQLEENYDTSFKVVDAVNYSSIATVDTRKYVSNMSLSQTGMLLAIVESENMDSELLATSAVRLYDVGISRKMEEDDPLSEDEDENDDINSDDSDESDDEDSDDDDEDGDSNNDDDDMDAENDSSRNNEEDSTIESSDENNMSDDNSNSSSIFFELSSDHVSSEGRNIRARTGGTGASSSAREGYRRGRSAGPARTVTSGGAVPQQPAEEEDDQWEDMDEDDNSNESGDFE